MSRSLVVIVEDNPVLSEVFAEVLEEVGFETEIIGDGLNAFRRIVEVIPALVILDLHLPHVSGLEILRQIRASVELAKTKVIIVTADAQRAEKIGEGTDLVLVKPVGMQQLQVLAKRVIDP